ncbi:unnamed protein product [Amaranthus hypochondriacus]
MDTFNIGVDQKQWPAWLPHDWCIHHNFNNTLHPQLHYYSNPRGKKFYSKEEVVEYLATKTEKSETKQIKRKAPKTEEKVITKKFKEEFELQPLSTRPHEWPDWLPDDWCIERSHKSPNTVHYCSPKWKKFETKEEVLNHIRTSSKKISNKLRKKTVSQRKN